MACVLIDQELALKGGSVHLVEPHIGSAGCIFVQECINVSVRCVNIQIGWVYRGPDSPWDLGIRKRSAYEFKRKRLGVISLERLFNMPCDPSTLSPLTLAFVGDGVYDLFVREQLACQANCPVGVLHKTAVKSVCCQAQSEGVKKLMPILTEEELAVYKRGRNAHTSHTPKNATSADYHAATGFEALFGYLYLKGEVIRLRELFDCIHAE